MTGVVVSDVHKTFGAVQALRGISLSITQGTVLALLGPSGCGKTTLLRLIAGFDPVTQGSIRFGERVVASPEVFVPPEHRGIGYVPQEGTLFPHLTVAGNISFGIPHRAHRARRIAEVLKLTGLEGLAERYPHELSGGQQQRVALARALAPKPALVLLDEPFNALDLDLRRRMSEEVTRILRRTGTTTILVTHDPGEAFAVSDQMAVMQAGEIMQCAAPEVVYWQPASPEVARLTGAAVFVDGECRQGQATCAFGRLRMQPGGPSCPANGSLSVMLRPEQVQWSDADCDGVPATVIERTFRGDHTIVRLELPSLCFDLRMPSLRAPGLGARGSVCISGACMAYPA